MRAFLLGMREIKMGNKTNCFPGGKKKKTPISVTN